MRQVFAIFISASILGAILVTAIILRIEPKTPEIYGVVNYLENKSYAMPNPNEYTVQGTDLHDKLRAHTGQMVYLELELTQSAKQGFAYQDAMGKRLKCNATTFGMVNNYGLSPSIRRDIVFQFHHPEHFHAPTEIIIGDQRDFPTHNMSCSYNNYVEGGEVTVKISGHFMINIAEIPTALDYHLTPVAIIPEPAPNGLF